MMVTSKKGEGVGGGGGGGGCGGREGSEGKKGGRLNEGGSGEAKVCEEEVSARCSHE